MRSAALECLAVLHHCFDGVGVERAGEAFVGCLDAFNDGHCHVFFGKARVGVDHKACAGFVFFGCGVCAVAFLPEEFGCAQEHACAHFPAHHVGPLVAEDGEVAPGVYPVFVCAPDDCFGCGAHDEFFFKAGFGVDDDACAVGVVFKTVVGNYGTFFCEAFYVLGFAAKE